MYHKSEICEMIVKREKYLNQLIMEKAWHFLHAGRTVYVKLCQRRCADYHAVCQVVIYTGFDNLSRELEIIIVECNQILREGNIA